MKIFETERLIVRQVFESDKVALLEFHNEPETMKFISDGKSEWAPDELNDKLKHNEWLYLLGFGIYCVENKFNREVIGEASVFNSFDNLKQPEIGYILSERFWNHGYGAEVVNGLLSYCTNYLKAERVIARMYSENIYSVRLCQNVGMALYEEAELKDGRIRLGYEYRGVF